MKTFSKTVSKALLRPFPILQKIILLVLISLVARPAFSQGTLSGFVADDEFGTPLEKAVVTIPGTLISVLTDQQGNFRMKLVGGNYSIRVNYPGYFEKFYNVSVSEGIFTPMFIIRLKANAVGRDMQRRITSFENKKQLPQTSENFSPWQIAEQTGHQEFNELFRTIPSVSFFGNGSGCNDSEIRFRGNDATRTSYTFNGILLNNPETGRVQPSMFSGLTDWAGQIQVISGQGANLHSQTQPGGLVNVLSFVPHEKAGAEISAVYGNAGLLKTTVAVHTGRTKKGLASSILISRTSGDGLAENTGFEQYNFFANMSKELNYRHTLVLNVNGILQQHNRNVSDTIGAYNFYGTRYNRNWGTRQEKPVSWSANFSKNPMISLTHFWQPRIKTHVTTQVFAQLNRTAQLSPGGMFNNQPVDYLPRDSAGHVPFNQITDWNRGLAVSSMGDTRTPDTNGKFINTGYSGISTLAAIDVENRFGLRSVITQNFSKKLDLSGSFDLEHYHASHFGAVHDLLGADGYSSFSDLNRPEGFPVENLFRAGFYPSFNAADKSGYFYESAIQTGGVSMRLNYQVSRYYWFLAGSASLRNTRRTNHFNNPETDQQTESILLPSANVQTGIRINFLKYHSVHLRTGYGSYQPLFSTIFPGGNNWRKSKITNEQAFDAEFGYTIFSRKLKIEALAYRSAITNRSEVKKSLAQNANVWGWIDGLNEIHQGIELKSSYKLTKNFQFYLNGSYSDLEYSDDATALPVNDLQPTETNKLLIKGAAIPNSPQFSIFAEAEYRWAHNFYIRLNYYRADRIYAPFGLHDFNDLADRNDFVQWQLPVWQLLGASGNYLLKIRKSNEINFFFGANNLLDSEYIEQSFTNIPETKPGYTSNQVYYGAGRSWFIGVKFQF